MRGNNERTFWQYCVFSHFGVLFSGKIFNNLKYVRIFADYADGKIFVFNFVKKNIL